MSVFVKVAKTQVDTAAFADRVVALATKVLGPFPLTTPSTNASPFAGMIGDLDNSGTIVDEKLADCATALAKLEELFA